jgi:DNA polymerase III alpha subunit
MRTIAEILRHLSQQREVNDQTRDMVAMLVYCLRGIDDTVEESVRAWEKRGYWKKADDFQQKWWWSTLMATSIEELLRSGNWDDLPNMMVKLYPHFADIQVNRITRDPAAWQGAYQQLTGTGAG